MSSTLRVGTLAATDMPTQVSLADAAYITPCASKENPYAPMGYVLLAIVIEAERGMHGTDSVP